jgi:hypothetical protein
MTTQPDMTPKAAINIVIDDLTDQKLQEESKCKDAIERGLMGEHFQCQARIEAIDVAIAQAKTRRKELDDLNPPDPKPWRQCVKGAA